MESEEDVKGSRRNVDVFFNAPHEDKHASIASGIPETVGTSKSPASFEWSYDTVNSFSAPMTWDERTQTLTAKSRGGETFSIIVTKQKNKQKK